jgi:hypothetical protein
MLSKAQLLVTHVRGGVEVLPWIEHECRASAKHTKSQPKGEKGERMQWHNRKAHTKLRFQQRAARQEWRERKQRTKYTQACMFKYPGTHRISLELPTIKAPIVMPEGERTLECASQQTMLECSREPREPVEAAEKPTKCTSVSMRMVAEETVKVKTAPRKTSVRLWDNNPTTT